MVLTMAMSYVFFLCIQMSQSPPNRVNGSHAVNLYNKGLSIQKSQSPPNRVNGSHEMKEILLQKQEMHVAIPS